MGQGRKTAKAAENYYTLPGDSHGAAANFGVDMRGWRHVGKCQVRAGKL